MTPPLQLERELGAARARRGRDNHMATADPHRVAPSRPLGLGAITIFIAVIAMVGSTRLGLQRQMRALGPEPAGIIPAVLYAERDGDALKTIARVNDDIADEVRADREGVVPSSSPGAPRASRPISPPRPASTVPRAPATEPEKPTPQGDPSPRNEPKPATAQTPEKPADNGGATPTRRSTPTTSAPAKKTIPTEPRPNRTKDTEPNR